MAPPAEPGEQATIEFEFQGASVNAILEWYAKLTNRSIISAPNLGGTINFRSQTKLTKDEAIQALDSVLAINNIAAIPLGDKFLKIVQINTAAQEGIPVGRLLSPADTLGTQIISLKYAEAQDIVAALQPYMHSYGKLMALVKSNSILISETAGNLKQMLEIISYVDQPSALRMEMRAYILANAKAADVVQRLTSIIQETQQAGGRAATPGQPQPQPLRRPQPGQPAAAGTVGGDGSSAVEGKVIMTADERTNKILILTRPSNFKFLDDIIAELDAKMEPDVVTKVIELKYANAEDVASLLNSLITGSGSPTTSTRRTNTGTTTTGARAPAIPPPPTVTSGAGLEGIGFLQFAAGLRLLPDPRTNSLLVMATKEDLERIEQLVKSVDTPVAQVIIEVVIAEINLDSELDVGVNVFKRLFEAGQTSQLGASITDGNGPIQLPRVQDVISGVASNLPNAQSLASGAGGLTYFITFRNLKLDAIIRALATSSKAKVLSTPNIQTLDNQEANILVGESRPVPISTLSSVVSGVGTLSANSAVTANIDYKDIAIELLVTPRINPGGYVRMDIDQKVNDFGGNISVGGTLAPIILKREAKSSVAVQDGSTIVLGGLIKESKLVTETKVPILGSIPFFGQIFKSTNSSKIRNELIIFIRPTVMRDNLQAVVEARRRARLLKGAEELGLDPNAVEGGMAPSTDPQREIDKLAAPNGSGAAKSSATPQKQTAVVQPAATSSSSAAVPSAVTPADRHSAKIKALQMQDGVPAAQ
jgi:general secretion pathway protein D